MGYLREKMQVFKLGRISGLKGGRYYTYAHTDMLLRMNELTECNEQTRKG